MSNDFVERPQVSRIGQRISNPKQRLPPFPKNRVFSLKNQHSAISSEDQKNMFAAHFVARY